MLQRKISKSHDVATLIERVGAEMGPEHGAYAALLFTWCIAHQDVEGRMHGDARIVRADVFPLIEAVTTSHVAAYLGHMATIGIVVWYEVEGRRWLAFPGFEDSQPGLRKDKEAASLAPDPSSGVPVAGGSRSGVSPELVRSKDGARTVEEKRREVEVKGKGKEVAPAAPPLPFRAAAAVEAIAAASAGRFVTSVLKPKQAIDIEAVIRGSPDIETWRLVGLWIAAGGDSWKGTLDVRHLGDIGAWIAQARQWNTSGRGPVARNGKPIASSVMDSASQAKGRELF